MPIDYIDLPVEPSAPENFLRAIRFFVRCVELPPPPPTYPSLAVPNNDTIRGGKEIVLVIVNGAVADVTGDESFKQLLAMPAAWARVGGAARLLPQGVEIATLGAPGGSAVLSRAGSVFYFDAAIDVELVAPSAVHEGRVTHADFTFTAVTGGVAPITSTLSVIVERDSSGLSARASSVMNSQTTTGNAARLSGTRFTLRIVRHGRFAYAFIGSRDNDRVYTSLTKLLAIDQFDITSGLFSFRVANGTRAINVRTTISNFTLEPHARIGSRLLENKATRFGRIIGTVPAATLPEVGFEDIAAFGPAGDAVLADGFEYTLPPARTIGLDTSHTLFTVQDAILKDKR